ncbi:MAG: rhodanese-like domain-containing protein [Spirochaetia bacterium]|nr:rhodanese-like domain-containing protein [Spirochaetia bacterium]
MKNTTPHFHWKAFFLMLAASLVAATVTALWSGIFSKELVTTPSGVILPKGVSLASLAEVKAASENKGAVLLDVRPKLAYKAGHIPNALSLPVEELTRALEELNLNEGKTYILYCDGGECYASISAAKALSAFGFKHLKVYKEGYEGWLADKVKP